MNNTDTFNRAVMDYPDVGNMSYEPYRLHTGHASYDSDNDSTSSITSSSYFEEHEPPLYTYEEIKANSVVIEPVSTQSKAIISYDGASKLIETDYVLQQIIKKELAELVLSDSCMLCNVRKCSEHNIGQHKMGMTHTKKVHQYIKDRLKNLHSLTLSEDKSLDKIALQEQLFIQMGPNYCYICNADLPSSTHFVSHYCSTRHINNCESWINAKVQKLQLSITSNAASWIVVPKTAKEPPVDVQNHLSQSNKQISTVASANQTEGMKNGVQNVKPAVDRFCKVCGINVDTGLQDHYKSDLHKSVMEAFCFVCNIRTMSKQQLGEHVKGARHRSNLKGNCKDLEVPQTIVTPVTKQGKKSSSSLPVIQTKPLNEKSDKITQVVANSHYKETSHIVKAKVAPFYCYICKLTFDSKTDVDYHVNSFPHNKLSKLMFNIVFKGISSTKSFWKIADFEITCKLCTIRMQSESSATDHLRSKRHLYNFTEWCSQQPTDRKDPNRRFFYCNICCFSLDGTTNAEVHYERHATTKQKETKRGLETASAISTVVLQPDTSTSKADTSANKNSNKLNPTGSKNDDTEAKNLEETLLTETVKFMYLLRSMPASRAVHYLQKCIKEIEN